MKRKAEQWLEISENDFEVAEQLFESRKFLYSIFFCQQAIEKAIKALFYERKNETPPRKHNLVSLVADTGILDEFDEATLDLLDTLSQFYIESRYSDERDSLSRHCNDKFTESILKQTGGVLNWLKDKLK